MIEPEDDLTATESGEDRAAATKVMEDRTPAGHDAEDDRGGAGGEAGAVPGMPASERTNERGHEARDEGVRDEADDAPARPGLPK